MELLHEGIHPVVVAGHLDGLSPGGGNRNYSHRRAIFRLARCCGCRVCRTINLLSKKTQEKHCTARLGVFYYILTTFFRSNCLTRIFLDSLLNVLLNQLLLQIVTHESLFSKGISCNKAQSISRIVLNMFPY